MTKPFIEVTINKPLFFHDSSPFVYIADKYIQKARKTGKLLRINTPQKTRVVNYKDWLINAKFIEKVFLIPDRPMKLWGNYL